jgi:hypothetical protein
LQWFHKPYHKNGANINNVRREIGRIFRNIKREYSKEKFHELETNRKNTSIRDLYRGINAFLKGYKV